ncbi:FAD-dependent oxidoreductase [Sphingomonas oligophenolica]|uniref:Thioredoxin reductase n=1 Tax=Sphingomonas oligophenolica TaxID=301154 RepID=A0ABU9Y942_9SPHN
MAAERTEIDPSDPLEREAQTFPVLSEAMVARMMPYGREEAVVRGTALYTRGERSVDFFVVLAGSIQVLDTDEHGVASVFTTHRARQFTGELDLFNNRAILVSGRAGEDGRVLRISPASFRRMVSAEADISELIMRAFILRRVGLIRHSHGGVTLIGSGHAADTLRMERFLERNAYPHRLLDIDVDPDAGGFLDCFSITPDQLPVVIGTDAKVLRNPSTPELADALGLTERLDPARIHDVVVVGAGPAGLAAAVYAASEGLDTIVIEGMAPGGQAGTSSKIENYLGFPTGISGQALAGRAQVQAQKFGARLALARPVVSLDCATEPYVVTLEDGQRVSARAVIVASGARYRKLDVPDYARFEGQGIHYAATAMEANLCAGEDVLVVGGGNSAGQAAVFLSRVARHVHILVRSHGLAATMSDYLVQRIMSSAQISLHAHSTVTGLEGESYLSHVTWTDLRTGAEQRHDIANMFVMIGAEPNTDWLDGCLALDARGFVQTGAEAPGATSGYATSKPGIFAIGDVRSGSVKRVASGVGEGSVVVSAVHQYLHPAA